VNDDIYNMNNVSNDKKESLVRKIRALLEKTVANGCTEQEATSAAATAQRLMDDYGVTLGEIEAAPDKTQLCEQGVFNTNERHHGSMHHVHFCGHAIAHFTNTEYFVRGDTKMVYFGFAADVAVAQYLTDVFRVAMHTEWKKYYAVPAHKTAINGYRKRAFRDFCVGMARRLSERLNDLWLEREAAMKPKGDSYALVVVKSQIVSAAYAELSKHFAKGRASNFRVHGDRYNAGYRAGNNVNIPAGGLENRAHRPQIGGAR